MRIEHAAVYVRDLAAARAFFVERLGAVAGPEYHNPRTGFRSHFLTFEGGARHAPSHHAAPVAAP